MFTQKGHLAIHKQRKRPCKRGHKSNTNIDIIEQLVEQKVTEILSIHRSEGAKIELSKIEYPFDTSPVTLRPLNTMDFSKKTREELIAVCKEKNVKGYSGKKKDDIVKLLQDGFSRENTDIPEYKNEADSYMISSSKKDMGQYFTVSDMLQRFVFDRVKHKSCRLLEPSFGAGHLLKMFKEYDDNYPIVCYELDTTIKPVVTFNQYQTPIYGDFTKQNITTKFKTIIGNPPYVKQKTGNLYIKFVELCYNYLEDEGELIFIVPSDFIKLTSASSIITTMVENGSFTDFLFPHDEKLFEEASVDVVVFRYEKGIRNNKTLVNGKEMLCNVNKGIITFSESEVSGNSIDSMFHVYVGLVSGRDEIYRVPFGNIEILNEKDRVEKYIYTETFPTENEEINTHLLSNKKELLGRRIKRYSENNWFEWGAPRNISSIRKYWGKNCIYIRNMTRSAEVAFIDTVQYFGGSLICLVPKEDMAICDLEKIIGYLNSANFQKDYMYAGRFKIGHKQISTAVIPY